MGDGRTPGEPPDHEGTSHMMDYIRVMGDGRTPGEPPDHYYKWTSQFLDYTRVMGMADHRENLLIMRGHHILWIISE